MEEGSNTVFELTSRLKEISSKNTAESIYNKINSVKQKNNDKETILILEEIINNLAADKNELIQITRCYEQEFTDRDISDTDIDYITRELMPILTSFLPFSGGNNEFISSIQKIFSSETLKILKLLGFNYKDAIGLPLTNMVSQAIQNQTSKFIGLKGSSKK